MSVVREFATLIPKFRLNAVQTRRGFGSLSLSTFFRIFTETRRCHEGVRLSALPSPSSLVHAETTKVETIIF